MCCLSVVDPNRAGGRHERLVSRPPLYPKIATRKRYRGTSTFSHLHSTRADDIACRTHPSLEQAGHTTSKSRGFPFKNEHSRFSFVICRNLFPFLRLGGPRVTSLGSEANSRSRSH